MNLKAIGELVHKSVMNGEKIAGDSPEERVANKMVASLTKQTIFVPVNNGVQIYYSCGTKRFIANSWYDDINTDSL
jgi:hypothetical protein